MTPKELRAQIRITYWTGFTRGFALAMIVCLLLTYFFDWGLHR
jgi:hypothetical protein